MSTTTDQTPLDADLDPDVRPQDDLFGHVNGPWLTRTEIPSDRSAWGSFVTLADTAEQQVREIITDLASGGHEPGSEAAKIAGLYASFMDTDAVAAAGTAPLRPLLDAVAALRDVRDLAALLGELERIGGHGLFGSYVTTDRKDSDRYLFHLAQGGLGLPDEAYYREEKFAEVREAYRAYLGTVLSLAEHPDPAGGARTVLDLDTRLATGHWERAETRDVEKTYHLLTLEQLVELCPGFDWRAYVTNLGGSEQTISEVCVREPSFFSHLDTLLAEVPLEVWQTWLTTHVVRSLAPYLTDPFVEANFDFYGRTLAGTPELRARWKRAVSFVEGSIGEAVGREYVARHFPPRSKELMDGLVTDLLEAYRTSISGLDWMTAETKQRALEKLGAFTPKIGHPERFRDYGTLEVRPGDLVANAQAAAAFATDYELAKIGSPVDRDEWFMLPQTVNAYYNPGTNEICFPAGILQPPFFDADAPAAVNYGAIGAVIGHEIGHGFDDQGSRYDGAGNLHDWWTEADRAAFDERSQALVAQYDAFEPRDLPGEHVNGPLTVGENIGDLGGITIAHRAYLMATDAAGTAPATPEERRELFLAFARVWRTKRRLEAARQLLAVDPHSPAEFRANVVRNLAEFHEAFGTAEGDGLWLDPAERVRIW